MRKRDARGAVAQLLGTVVAAGSVAAAPLALLASNIEAALAALVAQHARECVSLAHVHCCDY